MHRGPLVREKTCIYRDSDKGNKPFLFNVIKNAPWALANNSSYERASNNKD